jgi:hypothetical protein
VQLEWLHDRRRVTGSAGAGLVLQLNRGNDLSIVEQRSVRVRDAVQSGAATSDCAHAADESDAAVHGQQRLGHGAGSNVTNVAINCVSSSFTVGGYGERSRRLRASC